jgi:hypothetical protein
MACPLSISEGAAALPSSSWRIQTTTPGCSRDTKFNPLVLGEIQAADDTHGFNPQL